MFEHTSSLSIGGPLLGLCAMQ